MDDLNIAFSDEEMQESIMNPRPLTKKEYRGYGAEDDWEYDDHVGGGTLNQGIRSSKHKTKTVSVNLTQGFQYSDIYFEPPAEEANLVEKILLVRTRETKTEEERKKYGDKVEEFLVKYKNYSYLHANWATFDKILVGDKRFDGKVKRYKAKMASLGAFANLDDEPFNPEYTVVDRILDVTTQVRERGGGKEEMWRGGGMRREGGREGDMWRERGDMWREGGGYVERKRKGCGMGDRWREGGRGSYLL